MAAKTVSKTASKGSIPERITKFVKGAMSELKKVHWPTRRELVVYTIVVLVAVLIVSALLWVFDSLFSFLLSKLIIRG
ncbi:MAG: preprotein translocase subunit SecE [Clostridia bacterium]|nr:preprotein translocase subunit SecE [Clostridia bacterium]